MELVSTADVSGPQPVVPGIEQGDGLGESEGQLALMSPHILGTSTGATSLFSAALVAAACWAEIATTSTAMSRLGTKAYLEARQSPREVVKAFWLESVNTVNPILPAYSGNADAKYKLRWPMQTDRGRIFVRHLRLLDVFSEADSVWDDARSPDLQRHHDMATSFAHIAGQMVTAAKLSERACSATGMLCRTIVFGVLNGRAGGLD